MSGPATGGTTCEQPAHGTDSLASDGSWRSTVLAIARSDLRQRARSPKYLAVALLVAYLAQSVTAGDVQLFIGGGYTGVPNAAWFGGFVAVVGTTLLVLGGFSLVRGSITRDREPGLAQLVATAPVRTPTYLAGRWLGYFLVLATVTAALALATVAGFLLNGTGPLDLFALVSPFLVITLPTMALVAAVAVCFEAIAPLARTLGTAIYVFGVLLAISVVSLLPEPVFDLLGMVLVRESMLEAVPEAVAGLERLTFHIAQPGAGTVFTWHGIDWGLVELGSRAPILAAALLFWGVAILGFDRFRADAGLAGLFDALPELPTISGSFGGGSDEQASSDERSGSDSGERSDTATASATQPVTDREGFDPSDTAVSAVDRLGRVDPQTPDLLDPRVLLAELRVTLRGHRWLWYGAVCMALLVQLVAPLDAVRALVAPVALLLPLSAWSGLGVRERRHRTEELVFTAPRPLGQTVAVWLGGLAIGLVTVGGYAARLALAGDAGTLAAVLAGVAAAPALALAAGTWLGSARAFDTLYLVAWYLGPLQAVRPLDFVGATSVAPGRTAGYALIAVACLAAAALGRRRP